MDFEIVGEIKHIETISRGKGIRNLSRLQHVYGQGNWRKLKGNAFVQLADGSIHHAEIHWYQADNIGKKEFKIKFPFLD